MPNKGRQRKTYAKPGRLRRTQLFLLPFATQTDASEGSCLLSPFTNRVYLHPIRGRTALSVVTSFTDKLCRTTRVFRAASLCEMRLAKPVTFVFVGILSPWSVMNRNTGVIDDQHSIETLTIWPARCLCLESVVDLTTSWQLRRNHPTS